MTAKRNANAFEPDGTRGELVRLVRQIQALKIELDGLRKRPGAGRRLQAKERTLEQLRRRLANVARRTATDDLGNAA